jgi:Histidine kinase
MTTAMAGIFPAIAFFPRGMKPMSSAVTREDLRFALINLVPWTAYTGLFLFLFSLVGAKTSAMWALTIVVGACFWLLSGTLRTVALRKGWLELPAPAVLLRLLGGVLVGGFAGQLLVRGVMLVLDASGWVTIPPGDRYDAAHAFGYSLQMALLLGLWTAVWASWQFLRRHRQGELARLRAESQRNALELDALRARLNPHFVFNALNNVRALINEEPVRAREVVTRLSNILRHALEHSQRESASLSEELAVVEDYLAVESVHYEERLRVHRDIARDALDAQLPPMLLQLLVENAIKHGIARTPGGGELGVSAWRNGNRLAIEVSNPGRMDASAGGHGVGLAYLRGRLAREPGNHFELQQNGPRVLARLEISQ